jgi:hypothetical protein
MTMQNFTTYDAVTGEITGHFATNEPAAVPLNITPVPTPYGRAFIPGYHDRRTKRVNPQTRQVEDATPAPHPADVRYAIKQQIAALESRQHRAVREALLADAAQRLPALSYLMVIDEEITALRARLAEIPP